MLHKICNFGPSSHNLAILGTKMVQKWDFLKNPANPHDEIFSEGLVSHCSQISVWIMDPLCPPNPLGSCWKKIYLILEQFSNEFLRGCGFESRLRQFGFSTYLLWAITNVELHSSRYGIWCFVFSVTGNFWFGLELYTISFPLPCPQ